MVQQQQQEEEEEEQQEIAHQQPSKALDQDLSNRGDFIKKAMQQEDNDKKEEQKKEEDPKPEGNKIKMGSLRNKRKKQQ